MANLTKTYSQWQAIAEQYVDLHENAFVAACEASRGGRVSRLIKSDGSIVTYHNGAKVQA